MNEYIIKYRILLCYYNIRCCINFKHLSYKGYSRNAKEIIFYIFIEFTHLLDDKYKIDDLVNAERDGINIRLNKKLIYYYSYIHNSFTLYFAETYISRIAILNSKCFIKKNDIKKLINTISQNILD